MTDRIHNLLQQIHALEEELREVLHEQRQQIGFQIEGRRVEFSQAVKETHQKLKIGLLRWLGNSRPQNILSAPFIYGMIFPFLLLDLCLAIYQSVCFRLYNIPLVQRSHYIVIDRHHLAYLNAFEKFNCVYCGYVNGLIAYTREIAARTEQYWCPIKHARKTLGSHERYINFIDYGNGENYHSKQLDLRRALAKEHDSKKI